MMRPVRRSSGRVPGPAEVNVLAGDASRLSQARAAFLDPGGVLVGKRRAQIGLADPMCGRQRPEPPGNRAAQVGGAVRVGATKGRELEGRTRVAEEAVEHRGGGVLLCPGDGAIPAAPQTREHGVSCAARLTETRQVYCLRPPVCRVQPTPLIMPN